jgi:hypothetical protein
MNWNTDSSNYQLIVRWIFILWIVCDLLSTCRKFVKKINE